MANTFCGRNNEQEERSDEIPKKDPLMAAEYTDDNYININESSIL